MHKPVPDPLSYAELVKIARRAKESSTRDWCMIVMALTHGLRGAEVCGLTLDDVQDDHVRVIRKKGSLPTLRPISALAHHELTTQVPHNMDIALPSHAQVPRVQGVPVRVFWFPNRAFKAGIDVITVGRVRKRPFAGCFKYRQKIGIYVAVEALRTYREKVRRLPVNKLLEYARSCRVEKVMRLYLEAVL